MSFTEAPAALTARERAVFQVAAIVAAASRFLALSRSLWDWDEALFCLGMRSYDVSSHHPHPPGFPLYIVAAKAVRIFTNSDFHALQTVNIVAGLLLFPAMFMLARELRLAFTTSMIAAGLFVFFPNVWFYGGTAFSDVVSITLVVYAAAFLFRGCRDSNAYLIGALLLAVSIGIRPQNALVGLFPALFATWFRARQSIRDVIFAVLIGGSIVGVSYAGAIHFTGGVGPYVNAVQVHSEYITHVDSFRSPDRPPLWRLFDRFFIKQYQHPGLSIVTSLFVLVSIAGAARAKDRSMLYNALTFAPFAISAWLMLDRFSISRFAIGYQPMFAIFAADGMARLTRKPKYAALLGTALIGAFVIWTWPALTDVRTRMSPSVLGVDAVRSHLHPRHNDLFVAFPMTPFIDYLMPYFSYRMLFDERGLPLSVPARTPYLLTEIDHTEPTGWVFRRERDRLWNIARRHYFEVALEPMQRFAQFGDGWYPVERHGEEEWRWMRKHSVTTLPPQKGSARLRLQFDIPDELIATPPTITFLVNGAVIDRFKPAQAHLVREYDVTPGPAANTLEITTDRSLHEQGDTRELGLLLRNLSWGPV